MSVAEIRSFASETGCTINLDPMSPKFPQQRLSVYFHKPTTLQKGRTNASKVDDNIEIGNDNFLSGPSGLLNAMPLSDTT